MTSIFPRSDGSRAAKRIRAAPPVRGMLVVVLIADSKRSPAHGFDHDLVKPVDLDHLARLLSGNAFQGIPP